MDLSLKDVSISNFEGKNYILTLKNSYQIYFFKYLTGDWEDSLPVIVF